MARSQAPRHQRKQRASNWTIDETIELLKLRFQTDDIFTAFLNQSNKDDEKNNWRAVAARLSTERTWESCRMRLKTLTAKYKKLMKEDTRTGNNTEDAISYPEYWDTLLECLGPFSGLNGNAIADSEGRLATVCSPAEVAVIDSVEDSEAASESDCADPIHPDSAASFVQCVAGAPGNRIAAVDAVAASSARRSGKRPSVFSPIRELPSKRTKKDADLSTLASSMSTLVYHIVGKPSRPANAEIGSVQEDLASMRQDIFQMGGRVVQMEVKIDAVAEKIAGTVTNAVLATITSMLKANNSSAASSST